MIFRNCARVVDERCPSNSAHPDLALIDKHRPDYTVSCGEWEIGRIYQTRGGPDSLRWFGSMNANGPMTRSDRVATLEEAKVRFQRAGTPGRLGRRWKRRPSVGYRQTKASNLRRVTQPLLMALYAPLRRGGLPPEKWSSLLYGLWPD
jgi:hypothetical protein